MAHNANRLVVAEEMADDLKQVFVIAQVLRRSSSSKKKPVKRIGIYVAESNMGGDVIARRFAGDVPAGWNFVHHQRIYTLLGGGDDGIIACFTNTEVGIERIERLRGVAHG